jgi:CrcB protein
MIKNLLLVGLGGAAGSMLRYLTSVLVNKYTTVLFPWATFTINILGCLVIGFLVALTEKQPWAGDGFKYLFITGFCGGYTTFSAFANENFSLFNGGHSVTALTYIAASVVCGLLAVWAGLALGRWV